MASKKSRVEWYSVALSLPANASGKAPCQNVRVATLGLIGQGIPQCNQVKGAIIRDFADLIGPRGTKEIAARTREISRAAARRGK